MTKPITTKYIQTTPATAINPTVAWNHVDNAKFTSEKLEAVMQMFMSYCADKSNFEHSQYYINMAIAEVMDLCGKVQSEILKAHEALGGDE